MKCIPKNQGLSSFSKEKWLTAMFVTALEANEKDMN